MPTLHEHGRGAHVAEGPRGVAHFLLRQDGPAEQCAGLVQVRRDERGPGEELAFQCFDRLLCEQRIAGLRAHHGVNDEIRDVVLHDHVCDGFDERR